MGLVGSCSLLADEGADPAIVTAPGQSCMRAGHRACVYRGEGQGGPSQGCIPIKVLRLHDAPVITCCLSPLRDWGLRHVYCVREDAARPVLHVRGQGPTLCAWDRASHYCVREDAARPVLHVRGQGPILCDGGLRHLYCVARMQRVLYCTFEGRGQHFVTGACGTCSAFARMQRVLYCMFEGRVQYFLPGTARLCTACPRFASL